MVIFYTGMSDGWPMYDKVKMKILTIFLKSLRNHNKTRDSTKIKVKKKMNKLVDINNVVIYVRYARPRFASMWFQVFFFLKLKCV